jgi:aminodeoxychorismate lyase
MNPIVWWNGAFLNPDEVNISVQDRGLLYGDGLFETLRVQSGLPIHWSRHWHRFINSAMALGFKRSFDNTTLHAAACELARKNHHETGLLRITLSRGPGPRGYSAGQANAPWILLSTYPTAAPQPGHPSAWHLRTSRWRLSSTDPLTQHKTANRLLQVLARTEAEQQGAQEALLVNEHGMAVEASSANLFWWDKNRLHTSPLEAGVLPGITRGIVLELATRHQQPIRHSLVTPGDLIRSQGAFLTLTSQGIVGVSSLDGVPLVCAPRLADWHRRVLTFRE